MTGEELAELLKGATITYPSGQVPGMQLVVRYLPDKSMKGWVESISGGGNSFGIFGNWELDGRGYLCSKFQSTGGRQAGSCNAWFKMGERYFAARSEDRNEPTTPRSVKK